ncbi:MAG: methyl-accepting chemotaxis protein [Alphaproteobacteria bacterium]|nr:methyl-accepting chemotaxis protein [Alphaproteobacteria bacterium]
MSETHELVAAIEAMAGGDYEISITGDDAVSNALKKLLEKLRADTRAGLDHCVEVSIQTNECSIGTGKLLSEMREVDNNAQSIASAAEEMVASVREIATSSQAASSEANEVRHLVDQNSDRVQQAVTTMGDLAANVGQTLNQAQALSEASQEIGNIVETIEAIAKQTNLLALNATIEAARAGEAGRGFAVVAGEVKNLSSKTAEATDEIRTRIQGLRTDLGAIVGVMEGGATAIQTGKEMIDTVGLEIHEMGQRVGAVTERMTDVAAILEQQNSATNEVAGGVNNVAERIGATVHHLNGLADVVDRAQAAVVKQLGDLAKIQIEGSTIKLAKADHVIWKKRLADMAVGRTVLKPDELADHHSCRLGKWYYGPKSEAYRSQGAFRELESPHELVHKAGKAAASAFQAGDIQTAMAEIEKVESASVDVLAKLEDLDAA